MAKLQSLNIADNSPATLNRMYQNVGFALAAIPDKPPAVSVQVVRSSQGIKTYPVNASDAFLVVNALGGPMSIVLPVPARATQAVAIRKGPNTANAVTIVQADAKAFGSGQTSITLADGKDVTMVCDGNSWWPYGV